MPTYTTVNNVLALYPRIGSYSSISSSAIAFYITQAENEVNAYLANNYTLPFSSTPPMVETLSTEYSLVKILERFFTQEVGSRNEWVGERKNFVFDMLNKINMGDIGLIHQVSLLFTMLEIPFLAIQWNILQHLQCLMKLCNK